MIMPAVWRSGPRPSFPPRERSRRSRRLAPKGPPISAFKLFHPRKEEIMFSNLRKSLWMGLLMAVFLFPVSSWAIGDGGGHYGSDSTYHPTNDGGNFGLGLEFGEPGNWGVSGKFWVDRENAFQPAVKFTSGSSAVLQLDYLWHNFDIIRMKDTSGEMPLYIGIGGNLVLQSQV